MRIFGLLLAPLRSPLAKLFVDFFQDYMQNVHGKEIDLLRTTVKVPGKRPPRAVATVAPTASPKTNGLTKDRSTLQLGVGNTGGTTTTAKIFIHR